MVLIDACIQPIIPTHLNRLRKHQKELSEMDAAKKEAKETRRRELEDKLKTVPQQLSRYAYQPMSLAIKLSDELPASLRELKPESNLFQERFNNLQKRNIIETRVPVSSRRRYQIKEEEKYSYKYYDRK